MSFQIRKLDTQQTDFKEAMDKLLAWESVSDTQVQQTVLDILHQVKAHGDSAVVEYTNRFDHMQADSMSALEISQDELVKALENLPKEQVKLC